MTIRTLLLVALGLLLLSGSAMAADDVTNDNMVTEAERFLSGITMLDDSLDTAKRLFWSLATISLVWTMGMHVLRQDIGAMLMELLRFMVVTGTFYWLLVNASSREGGEGFIHSIVGSFFELSEGNDVGSDFRVQASRFLQRGTGILFATLLAATDGAEGDQLLTGGLAILIAILLTVVAAQFLVVLVAAWFLGYAGVFLLGFGGSRWTSSVAINYYKHALAMGVTVLVLGFVGKGGLRLLDAIPNKGMQSAEPQFLFLGLTLAASVLILALAIRLPQFFYTLVTGSHMGLLAGSADIIGTAIAVGGGAALSAAAGRSSAAPGGFSGGGGSTHTDSVMDAVQRSSQSGAAGDPFHVTTGADPFAGARSADALRGSVFDKP